MTLNSVGQGTNNPFAQIIKATPFNQNLAELRDRVLAARSDDGITSLLEEIKFRIDLCLETQCENDQPYYYLLRSYCHLWLEKTDQAINTARYATDGFRLCGHKITLTYAHWYLGTIYATQRKGYLYRKEIEQAIECAELISQEFLDEGHYDEADKWKNIILKLQQHKEAALKMGTGPLHMPDTPIQIKPHTTASNTPADAFLHLPWLPKYHSILAGPAGKIWAEPIKEHAVFASQFEIDGKKIKIYPLSGTVSGDRKITLSAQEEYGWAQVHGHSMNASRPIPICEGDYVLFHIHNHPQNNNIVVASRPTQEGDYAHMVKRYRESDKQLISETTDTSQTYEPVTVDQDYQILGVVIAVAKPEP